MHIETTSVQQTANEVLGTKEKSLYYLIVKNKKGSKLVINVGQKTHDEVKKLAEEEEKFNNTVEELKTKNGGKPTNS